MAMASLSVCTADTHAHTHTDTVTQTCRHTDTLFPHQRNRANPLMSTTMERRGEKRKIHSFIQTLAWCRSTPYMDSFLAFSRNWVSACAGVIPLNTQKGELQQTASD